MGSKKMGRPPLFSSEEELQQKIDEYFDNLGEKNPTVSGMAYALGFTNRTSMYEYIWRDNFSDTIKKAIGRVEISYEESLMSKNSGGAIFALKNMGWSDKQEIDHKNDGGKFDNNQVDLTKLDLETLKKIKEASNDSE